ncbi:AmmeMemoRadiSam system protein B [Hippea sp. KM1]|uniref:AmmeMemoRadiSam system protein B n=1 Tax=Hippea sp. KM1 TaxID=944481 RepID=UPI00046D89E9|nr:AmmeMemoRadiSam system protein B [Hippea sp. KM1]
MQIRKPAVADLFYPASPEELHAYLNSVMFEPEKKIKPKALIVPHAGYVYSGEVAAKAYSLIDSFDTYIVMGPNHTGLGAEISIFDGIYQMPFGDVEPDIELIEAIAKNEYAQIDYYAHLQEHSIEVQLPFINYISKKPYKIVPIVVGTHNVAKLYSMAETIAEIVRNANKDILMVVSTDMNHYEDQTITLMKDKDAIGMLKQLDENGLMRITQLKGITMCGVSAAYIAIAAAKMLNAKSCQIVEHKTSGDVSGDYTKVVGYLSAYIE